MPFIRIFGLINAFVVENVRQQRELERHEDVSTLLASEGGLIQRMLASRFAKDMGFADGELPALESSAEAAENDFGADALPIHSGEIYKMATYVAGGDPREDIEVIVQRWVARRFTPRYEPSQSVRDAARLIGGWHRRGPLTALACILGGRLDGAKTLVAASVPPDLHVAYAPTVLLPYIVRCLERMRELSDATVSDSLSAEMAVAGCLTPPRFIFRTCKRDIDVSFSSRPLPAGTLIILPARRLGAAGDGSSAFGSEDAARYPAIRLIRRLLTRVWIASREVNYPAAYSYPSATQRLAVQRAPSQPIPLRRAIARQQVMVEQVTAIQAAAVEAAALEIGGLPALPAPSEPLSLPPGGAAPPLATMEPAAVERTVLQPRFELASLTRTLPFGNELGRERRRRKNTERRAERRRARKRSDRTVPGPF